MTTCGMGVVSLRLCAMTIRDALCVSGGRRWPQAEEARPPGRALKIFFGFFDLEFQRGGRLQKKFLEFGLDFLFLNFDDFIFHVFARVWQFAFPKPLEVVRELGEGCSGYHAERMRSGCGADAERMRSGCG
jgi:hypothetical protein